MNRVKDPQLIALSTLALYSKTGVREFDRDSLPGLRKSLSHCHDVNQQIIRANDEQRQQIITLRQSLEWEKTWRWGIVAGVVISIIAAFALHFAAL